jgi:hypothetical protein
MSTKDARLVDRIRQQFDTGALPRVHPQRTFGGWGVDDPCRGCCDPMRRGQGVREFDIAGQTYRLHVACYGLWEGELIRRGLFTPR